MADSEDSFILISANNTAPSIHSIDGWSEISIPSIRSNPIPPKNTPKNTQFSVFTGTYLQNSTTFLPDFLHHNNTANTANSEGFYLVSAPIQFSHSLTHDSSGNEIINNLAVNANANLSIGSVGSRVPFSWAEITKIQPQFHNQTNKPKVFDKKTPKIQTRYRKNNNKNKKNSPKIAPIGIVSNTSSDEMMPSIPEAKTSIITPKRRRSRLRYCAGKRNKRWRKKTQKLK